MNNSIWAETAQLPEFPKLNQNLKTDVLVVGGGMAGLLSAFLLTRAGVDCTLIEADRICHGVTRNTTAKLTSQHGLIYSKLLREFGPEAARLYWDANEQALEQYRLFASEINCDFESQDAYVYTTGSPEQLEAEMRALEMLHIPAEYLTELKLPLPTTGAIRFQKQAQFHPLKFASAIAGDLKIYEHTAARAISNHTVFTDQHKIQAKAIIIATHFPILNKHGFYFLKQYQQRSYVLALEDDQNINGMYVDASGSGLSLRQYHGQLLLGGGGHRTGKNGAGWAALEMAAQKYFPNALIHSRWATQDCMTLDGIPYIGQYGKHTPGIYVATGFNKWGMTSAMAAGFVLRDMILGKRSPYAALFSPRRRMLRPQLLINAGEAVKNLLTPTTPRCPHMGCALKWNAQEHSWDCPCHGSRFTENGILLDNPARKNLPMNNAKE